MPVRSFGDQLLCFFPHHVWRTTQGRRIEAEHLALHRVTLVYVVIVIAYGQWLLMRFYKVKDASFSHETLCTIVKRFWVSHKESSS